MTSYFYHKCEKYDPKVPMALFLEVAWLDEFENQEGYKILLDHHPDNYESYTKKYRFDPFWSCSWRTDKDIWKRNIWEKLGFPTEVLWWIF